MTDTPAQVAIFWDFDSCPASPSLSGYTVVDEIRTLALRFGLIKTFKAYLTVSDHQTTTAGSSLRLLTLRSELQSSGVSLTDVPHGKDAVGKMLLVDMLAFAFDQSPGGIVLVVITADHTHGYGFSILRMRSYQLVLLTPERAATLPLTSQATVSYNWTFNEASEDALQPPASPRICPKGRGRACSREEKSERGAADYGASLAQQESIVPPLCRTLECSTTKVPRAMNSTEMNFSDYRPREDPAVEKFENLEARSPLHMTIPENVGALDAFEEDEIVLDVPDDDEEGNIAIAIPLSGVEREVLLSKQEEKNVDLTLARSTLATAAFVENGDEKAPGGPVATGPGFPLETVPGEAHQPKLGRPSSPMLPAHDIHTEGPPAYTAQHNIPPSFHFMQPSELSTSSHSVSSSILHPPSNTELPSAESSYTTTFVQDSSLPILADSVNGENAALTIDSLSKESPVQAIPQLLPPLSREEYTTGQTSATGGMSGPSLASRPPWSPSTTTSFNAKVPAHYNILLNVMEEYRKEGVLVVRRAFLGEQLPKRQPTIYAQAGIDGAGRPLKIYIDGAIHAGILVRESEENVSLAEAYIRQAPKTSTSGPPNATFTAVGSSQSASRRQGVPPHFGVLLDVMEELRDADQTTYVSRKYLGFILPQRQPNVYALAGVTGAAKPSRKYIDTAIDLGLIVREPNDNVALPGAHIPAHFTTLVLFMREQLAAGAADVRRMTLGAELPKRQASIYAQAGLGAASKPLKKYVDAAIEAEVLVRVTEEYVSLNASYR